MTGNPGGRIRRALRNGLVSGWASSDVSSKELTSVGTPKPEASQTIWTFELWCNGNKVADVVQSPEAFSGPENGWAFFAKVPTHIFSEAAEVSLVAARDTDRQTVDTATVSKELVGIDGIHANGTLAGWALHGERGPRALAVYLGGKKIGTALADHYHPEFPLEYSDFVGFSIVVPVRAKQRGIGKSLEIHDLDTGGCLISVSFEKIQELQGMRRSVLPVDVVSAARTGAVYSEEVITSYIARHGYEDFVRMAYAYLLERTADQGGLTSFTSDLVAGRMKPIDLMNNMLQSEERRRRGPFLGPYVGDANYPFGKAVSSTGTMMAAENVNRDAVGDERQYLPSDLAQRLAKIESTLAELKTKSVVAPARDTQIGDSPDYRESLVDRLLSLWQRSRAEKVLALADAARDKRDWHSASKLYRQVLVVRPDLLSIWVQYGHSLKETGRLVEAEESYRKALSLNGAIADTHLQLGHVLKLQGRIEEARDSYQSATVLSSPADPSGRYAYDELASLSPRS